MGSSLIYEYIPTTLNIITFIGASTAFFAASVGLVQNDIKRIIAYSTCSQLGYMVFTCGLSNYNVGAFYSTRLIYFVFLSPPNGYRIVYSNVKDSGISISFALVTLTIPTLFFGYYAKDMFIGLG